MRRVNSNRSVVRTIYISARKSSPPRATILNPSPRSLHPRAPGCETPRRGWARRPLVRKQALFHPTVSGGYASSHGASSPAPCTCRPGAAPCFRPRGREGDHTRTRDPYERTSDQVIYIRRSTSLVRSESVHNPATRPPASPRRQAACQPERRQANVDTGARTAEPMRAITVPITGWSAPEARGASAHVSSSPSVEEAAGEGGHRRPHR